MRAFGSMTILLFAAVVMAAEDSGASDADEAIAAAITFLEGQLEDATDPAVQARIRKAIRRLEVVRDGATSEEAAAAVNFDVKPAVLKKKFKGRAAYDAKTGLLTLTYDFGKKDQLKDFDLGDAKPVMADQALVLEAGDKITHIAKFRSFAVKGIWLVKVMDSGGVASTSGPQILIAASNVYLQNPGGQGEMKSVAREFRTGAIPFQFGVNANKIKIQYANERLAKPPAKTDEIHQIVFDGGHQGNGFAKIVIAGEPEPEWFQSFLEAK